MNASEPAKNYKLEKGKNGVLLVTAKKSQNENAEKIYGEDSGTLEDVYEPYLIKNGFLNRTPKGRVASDFAYRHLGIPKGEE